MSTLQLAFPGLNTVSEATDTLASPKPLNIAQKAISSSTITSNESSELYKGKDLGTFKDSLRAPIHRWFKYPAGYSYKFVNATFEQFGIKKGDWVYEPFSGTGTTLLCAKQAGINGYGVEAHSFVHWISKVKLYWGFELNEFQRQLGQLLMIGHQFVNDKMVDVELDGIFPELVYKCYHPKDLQQLYLVREYILHNVSDEHVQDFLKVALTDTLRESAAAGTGWPYISPRKNKGDKPPKDALSIFEKTCRRMSSDLSFVCFATERPWSEIRLVLGDSRTQQDLPNGQIDIAITSPPYLNNYDYADRTRLETYFWGLAKSWGDITRNYRDKLMRAATTQISRRQYNLHTVLNSEIKDIAPEVFNTLQPKVIQLSELRLKKKGKKSYDLMTALYFNDIFSVLRETHRVLRKGGKFCLVLGDSAPYGVHIETDNLIGELGLGIGFEKFEYYELRRRGGKWKDNPQRHSVPLREGVVVLTK